MVLIKQDSLKLANKHLKTYQFIDLKNFLLPIKPEVLNCRGSKCKSMKVLAVRKILTNSKYYTSVKYLENSDLKIKKEKKFLNALKYIVLLELILCLKKFTMYNYILPRKICISDNLKARFSQYKQNDLISLVVSVGCYID